MAIDGSYGVHVLWRSSEPVDDETLKIIGAELQPDDESFCFWVDEKDPLTLAAGWTVRARSIEEAARLCKAAIGPLRRRLDFNARLTRIGVSDDEGQWWTTNPDADIPD